MERAIINGQTKLRKKGAGLFLFHLGAILTVTVWGTSFVSTEILLSNGLGPVLIYVYRFTLAYFILLCIDHKKFFSDNIRDEFLLLLCGITSGSIYFIAENTALEYTRVANVSLITSLAPLLTALLVGFLYKSDRPSLGTWIGSAVAFMGVGCVIMSGSSADTHESGILGDFLSLTAALSWAIYSIILRRISANYTTTFITRKTLFYGVLTALPFLSTESVFPGTNIMERPQVWGNFLFLGLMASLICFFLWSVSVKKLGAVKASNYLYFQPVVTLLFGWLILSETVSPIGYVGCLLVIGGLILGDYLSKYMRRPNARK